MEKQENGTVYDKFDSTAVKQNEVMTHYNWKRAHEDEEAKKQLEENIEKILKASNIDFDGKSFFDVLSGKKKIGRDKLLQIMKALAIAGISYTTLVAIAKPVEKYVIEPVSNEFGFMKVEGDINDLVKYIVTIDPVFELNPNFVVEQDKNDKIKIKSSDAKGYNDLRKYLTEYSKNESGVGLNDDQAIYAISSCGATENLYETYYGVTYAQLLEKYFHGPGSEINTSSYINYIQVGAPIPNPANDGKKGSKGIAFEDGIYNLEERIYNLDLQEESGKALWIWKIW